MATGEVAARTGAGVLLHADDRWLYDHAVMQTEAFGIRRSDGKPWQPPPPPTHELRGDEVIGFGHQETPAIRKSIRERLLTLPDDTLVIPGHGRETSVLREREENPHVGRKAGRKAGRM